MTAPSLADIEAARERLAGAARVTPVYSSETLGRRSGRPVFLKAANLQRTGSFKIRGAGNKLATLGPSEREAGVVAASAVDGSGPACALLSGGNIDPTLLMEVVRHGLTQASR